MLIPRSTPVPRRRSALEHGLDVDVRRPLGEHFVQFRACRAPAQRVCDAAGARGSRPWMSELRIHDAEVHHRVDLHRDVVARDHVLRRHVEHHDAQVHAHHLLHARDDDDQSRPHHALEAPEQEHHPALVFAQHANGRDHQNNDDDQGAKGEIGHGQPPLRESGTASRTRPWIAVTRRRSPARSGMAQRTRQRSPCTRAQPSPCRSRAPRPRPPTSPRGR